MANDPSQMSRAERRRAERQDDGTSARRRWLKWGLALAAIALIAISFADALGFFRSTSYTAVPHGSHSHYVPDRCEGARTGNFPTRPPREGERITCEGNIVSE